MPAAPAEPGSDRLLPRALWPRLHLFEWNDQPWLPSWLRRAETDYLATAIDVARPFTPLAPRIASLAAVAEPEQVIDLCSGGAGPWPHLAGEVAAARGQPVPVLLTDLFPDPDAFARATAAAGAVTGAADPVDATAVPDRLRGVRTMFDGFHHFRPADARRILVDAHRRRQPIVIADALQRRLLGVLPMLILIPLLVLLLTPRIRPLTPRRLLFTYLIPLLPFLITWDGVVSALRAYRPAELRALAAGLDDFTWEAGTVRKRGAVVTYLIGTPRVTTSAAP